MSRTKAVFVSSTFHDMHAERDIIASNVLPLLQEECEALGIIPKFVDLRWGVTTSGQQDKELEVLQVCLDEIDRCHPYFIVLLGERYGYVPEQLILNQIAESKGLGSVQSDSSVTSLEIEYGIFSLRADRCFFYFRDPIQGLLATERDAYSDAVCAPDRYRRLERLKAKILQDYPDKVRRYRGQWNSAHGRLEGLDAFAGQVKADLMQAIRNDAKQETAVYSDEWVSEERRRQQQFIYELAQFPCGGDIETLYASLCRAFQSNPMRHVRFSGRVGNEAVIYAGLAKTIAEQSGHLVLPFAFTAYSGQHACRAMLAVWNGILAEQLGEAASFRDASLHELIQTFEAHTARLHQPITCMLYEQTATPEDMVLENLGWLPRCENIRIFHVYDGGDGKETTRFNKFLASLHAAHVENGLTQSHIPALIRDLAAYHHKTLPDTVADALSRRLQNTDTPYPYAILRMFINDLSLMDQQEFSYLNAQYRHLAPEERIQQYLLDKINALPTGGGALEKCLDVVIQRLEKRLPKAFIEAALAILVFTPQTVGEDDVLAILENGYGMENCRIRLSWLLKWLRPVLRRTEDSIYFREDYYTAAVMGRCSPLQETCLGHIADYLAALPDDSRYKRENAALVFLSAKRFGDFFDWLGRLSKTQSDFADCARLLWKVFYREDYYITEPLMIMLARQCRNEDDYRVLASMAVKVGVPYFAQFEYFAYIQRICIRLLAEGLARNYMWADLSAKAELFQLLVALPTENLTVKDLTVGGIDLFNALNAFQNEVLASAQQTVFLLPDLLDFTIEARLFSANVQNGNPNWSAPRNWSSLKVSKNRIH